MTYIFSTMIVPASLGAKAIAITNALGYPHKGMFTAKVDDAGATVGYISTGSLPSDSPVIQDAATLWAAVQDGTPGAVTLADCQAFVKAIDKSEANPQQRQALIVDEVKLSTSAPAWVQPTGAHDAYAMDAAVTHGGKGWRSLVAANVWQPGVSGWRELWGSYGAAEPWPAWVQPTGAHDAYPLNAQVSHGGKHWKSTAANNVWAPGVYGWSEVP